MELIASDLWCQAFASSACELTDRATRRAEEGRQAWGRSAAGEKRPHCVRAESVGDGHQREGDEQRHERLDLPVSVRMLLVRRRGPVAHAEHDGDVGQEV